MKSTKKRSSVKFRPIFRPNLGEEQKKKKKVFTQGPSRFSPELTQISSQKPESLMPNLQRGGACLNFAHFTMQFCNLSNPKGGAMAQWPPPKYAPGSAAVFLAEKTAALQRCFLSKFSATATTAATPINSFQDFFNLHFHTLPFGVFTLRLFSLCCCYLVISV